MPPVNKKINTTDISTAPTKLSKKIYTRDFQRNVSINVLFDNGHGQYYNASRVSQFLRDLERTFWVEVDVNYGSITGSLLSDYDILILTNPQTGLTQTEIDAIKSFVDNGGALLICGDYYAYFDPQYYNDITSSYGIEWYDVSVYDDTNYDYRNYYPIIHTWETNEIARQLSDNYTYTVKVSGTSLKITNSSVNIIGTGDDDSYAKDSSGTVVLSGSEVVVFAAIDLQNGGRIFASGSSSFLKTSSYIYLNFDFDNKFFALEVFEWLLKEFVDDIFDIVTGDNEKLTVSCSPDCGFNTLENFLLSANETVYMMVYQFTHPEIYNILYQLKQQKPSITIKAVIQENHTGGQDDDETRYIADKMVNELGATVKWANEDIYSLTHAKFVIIDNKSVMISTGNLKDVNFPINNNFGNRDLQVIINNKKVVDLFLEIFINDFDLAVDYSPGTTAQDTYGDTGTYVPKFDAKNITASPKYLPMFSPEGVYYHLKKLIRRAQHFIYLYIPYASTTISHVVALLDELGNATNRGVTVLAITNDYDTKVALENRGINVIYTPSDLASLHAKSIIIDDKIVVIGSSNWSSTGLGVRSTSNRESGIAIWATNIATYYRDVFGYDWERKIGSFDSDGDGLCDLYEQDHSLNTTNNDTDGDNISDWEEVVIYDSDPLDPNSPEVSPPNVEIISPTNGTTLNTSAIHVTWSASDPDGIDYCEIRLDENSWINVGSSTEYTFYDIKDGYHTIYVRAYDTTGTSNITNSNITVNAPPTVSFNDPVNQDSSEYEVYSASGSVTIGWSADDNSGVDHGEIRINYGAWENIGNVSCYTITGLYEGNHTIEIKIVDINGNYNLSSINIVVDFTLPYLQFGSDRYIADTSNSDIYISWTGGDNIGLSYYMVKIGNTPWKYVGTNTSIRIPNTLAEGIHSVYIQAVDLAGNYNVSKTLLIVDRTPPNIEVLEPENNTYIATETITISWNTSDNMAAFSSIRIDNQNWINLERATSYKANLPEGQHTIEILVQDLVGNNNTTKIIIHVDITNPNITIISPNDCDVVSSSEVTVIWNGTDNYNIAYYLVRVDDQNWIKTNSNNHTFVLSDGVHTITVIAIDNAGNSAQSEIVITVSASKSIPKSNTTASTPYSIPSQKNETKELSFTYSDKFIFSNLNYCCISLLFQN